MVTLDENQDAAFHYTSTTHNDTYDYISPSKFNLNGKSVFITGASKGIGRATALSYATAGASRIGIAARSGLSTLVTELKEAAKKANHPEPQVVAAEVDVSSEASIKAAAEKIGQEFDGKLDFLVNNAGFSEEWVPFAVSKPSEWTRTIDINITGLYLSTRYFLPLVLASQSKTIINVSSIGAVHVTPGASAYQTSKFAVTRLTEFLDVDHGKEGLTAIALHPGGVWTELASRLPTSLHHYLSDKVELAADTMVWIAGGDRKWLSGRYVSATWDLEELEAKRAEIEKGDLLKFRLLI